MTRERKAYITGLLLGLFFASVGMVIGVLIPSIMGG